MGDMEASREKADGCNWLKTKDIALYIAHS